MRLGFDNPENSFPVVKLPSLSRKQCWTLQGVGKQCNDPWLKPLIQKIYMFSIKAAHISAASKEVSTLGFSQFPSLNQLRLKS